MTAPPGTHIRAETVGGTITVQGIHGDLTVSTIGGDLKLTDVGRLTSAHTVGGNISIDGATTDGSLDVGTIGGDVTLSRITARRVTVGVIGGDITAKAMTCDGADLHSMSGGLEYAGPLARNGHYELHTHSGDVRFVPSGGVGFELNASTFSGEVRSDLPLQGARAAQERSARVKSLKGTYGDGSAVVEATTFSGDVVVAKR